MAGEKEKNLVVQSVAFSQDGHIPKKYSCDGENINPPLEINSVPENARSIALIMEDPDTVRRLRRMSFRFHLLGRHARE